jgi:hypothetical protein
MKKIWIIPYFMTYFAFFNIKYFCHARKFGYRGISG